MDSLVCGFTLSSAATISKTISAIEPPLTLIRSKASWPGVSMKDILAEGFSGCGQTVNADIFCVIPPYSQACTLVFLIWSSIVVLP